MPRSTGSVANGSPAFGQYVPTGPGGAYQPWALVVLLDQLVELVSHGRLDITGSISDTMPLEDVARGVRRLATKDGNPIRLVVTP